MNTFGAPSAGGDGELLLADVAKVRQTITATERDLREAWRRALIDANGDDLERFADAGRGLRIAKRALDALDEEFIARRRSARWPGEEPDGPARAAGGSL